MRRRRRGGYAYVCVFIHNTPRFHSQTDPTRAPAILVCAGSFISSPITGPLFPLWFWTGFKTLIIAAVTSERRESMWKWRPAGVFFPCSSPHVWHRGAFVVFHSHTHRQCHPALPGLARVTSLSLAGKRLCLVGVCGQRGFRVVQSDSEVMWEAPLWHAAVIANNFLFTFFFSWFTLLMQ